MIRRLALRARHFAAWPLRAWLRAEIASLESWRESLMRNSAFAEAHQATSDLEATRVRLARLEAL